MKFNLKRSQVILKHHPRSPGMFIVEEGCEFLDSGTVMRMEYIEKNLRAADGEALMLIDPKRNERLMKQL